jgi:hypothetical protein
MDLEPLLVVLEDELRTALNTAVTGLVAMTRTRLEDVVAKIAEERIAAFAEVDRRRGELSREIDAMQMHQEKQEGWVELNIGGYRFETSVQTLRRVPHTFFDAYFSGRYVQDVCCDDSIFVDRDGEHFVHVLEYMRDGMVSVVEPAARPSVSLLRVLKREFAFYCIELNANQDTEPEQPDVPYIMGGRGNDGALSSIERYDASTGTWSAAAAMGTMRCAFGACVLSG